EKSEKHCVFTKTYLVFEMKNNLHPVVLMTKQEFHPNTPYEDELKEVVTIPEGIFYNQREGYYENLLQNEDCIYTQYCSFKEKNINNKNKIVIANHPENWLSGFAKINQYCDEAIDRWLGDRTSNNYLYQVIDEYFRHLLFIPILLINDNLYELDVEKNEVSLRKVESSKLVYNYHLHNEPKMSIIFVMTKKGLNQFLPKMRAIEKNVEDKMINSKDKKFPKIDENS
ncbi:MAG: hypothetical protein U9P73_07235, partial [Candidatus Cloacimonadota bacterium]|nr:hypothetical protein [Candidatus Cloacimonadota bacterium]